MCEGFCLPAYVCAPHAYLVLVEARRGQWVDTLQVEWVLAAELSLQFFSFGGGRISVYVGEHTGSCYVVLAVLAPGM